MTKRRCICLVLTIIAVLALRTAHLTTIAITTIVILLFIASLRGPER